MGETDDYRLESSMLYQKVRLLTRGSYPQFLKIPAIKKLI